MERFKRQIPDGVQDTLPAECMHKRALMERIRRVFLMSGCFEVETPTFEYYDVFASGIGSVRQEKVLKFFEGNGRILVLRPDITMPIARLCATRLYQGEQLRLCYAGNAFGAEDSSFASQKEFTQMGVELIGVSGAAADAEVICTAIEALDAAGLSDYTIELGQVEFFKGLMEEAGVGPKEADALRFAVDEKNLLGVELCLKNLNLPDELAQRIKQMTSLYGGPEVFDLAYRFSENERCRAAVENLREVYAALCDFGLERRVSVDLAMLQSLDYYSGIVFKGISAQLGQPILSGGRYDRLLSEFGVWAPATGFSMGIKRILIAMERQGALEGEPQVDAVISASRQKRGEAYQKAGEMRRKGVVTELALHLDRAELERYAAQKGAMPIYIEEAPCNR